MWGGVGRGLTRDSCKGELGSPYHPGMPHTLLLRGGGAGAGEGRLPRTETKPLVKLLVIVQRLMSAKYVLETLQE